MLSSSLEIRRYVSKGVICSTFFDGCSVIQLVGSLRVHVTFVLVLQKINKETEMYNHQDVTKLKSCTCRVFTSTEVNLTLD